MQLLTYLNYGGNCRQAFEYYALHLGGTITMMMTHGEGPGGVPMAEMFFAKRFAMLRDRLGTSWMLLYETAIKV